MIRLALPFAIIAIVFLLGNALSDADWLVAAALGLLLLVGFFELTAPPASSGVPTPARAAEDARATGMGR